MPSYLRSGPEISVNTQTAGDQFRSSLTRLADGSLVLVWQTSNTSQDGSGAAIMRRHYSASGVPLGGETVVNTSTTGDQIRPQVTSLASGGYVVTWETADTTRDGSGSAIMGRVYDSAGVALGNDFRMNTLATADQRQPTVAGLGDGSFVVIWHTTDTVQDGSGWSMRGQRFDAAGAVLGAEFRVNTSAFGSQNNADIAVLADGRFVVSWQHGNTGSSEVHAQVYNANGTAQGGQIYVGFSGNVDSSVVALSDGGFVVAYGRGGGIWFQRYDVNRIAVGGEQYAGDGFLPEASALTEGGFVIAWRGGSTTISARSFSATGAATSTVFTISADADSSVEASIVNLAGGGFAASWTNGFSGSGTGQDIRLGIFQPQANTAPELGAATRNISVAENAVTVVTITATDDGGPSPVTYSITGGADAARFAINATTGALTFIAASNFEAPTDAGANNVYDVIVRASDGALSDTQAIAVTVTNVNEAPVIASNGAGATASISLVENSVVAANVTAADSENATLTYSISGGLDAGLFTINAATGVLSFVTAPNFEAPADNGANNVYNVTVRVTDGVLADTQALTITVTDNNETPVIVSNGGGASASVAMIEGQIAVATVAASDPENASIIYAISGGADAALFAIDAVTGALSFLAAPDFESGGDNVYDVVVSASDGTTADTQTLSITVGNVNEGVSITSGDVFPVAENGTVVTTVTATDVDGDAITYSIVGGADAALFAIDAVTGALSFVSAPDFETSGDNVYEVAVSASDGTLSDTRTLSVAVTNVNEAVAITSGAAFTVAENATAVTTVAATDIDGDPIAYSISGGADAALFTIDAATGALSFIAAPNFEAPGDAGGDNAYDVVVAASDGTLSDSRALSVTVANANDLAPVIGVYQSDEIVISFPEGYATLIDIDATDAESDAITYSLVGVDAGLFAIDANTGAVTFLSTPDFETPGSGNGTNSYSLSVIASDGLLTDTIGITVHIRNVNEAIAITSGAAFTVAENGTAVATMTASDVDGDAPIWSIAGGADAARFAIDAATGVLSFIAAPDFDAPGDAGGDNIYDVIVRASDGALSDTRALAVTVTNLNEAPVITSGGGGAFSSWGVLEGNTAVTVIVGADPEGAAVSYSIAGGPDAARFTIDAVTGALAFIAAPDFEAPTDAGANNVYELIVAASDGTGSATQTVFVTVDDVNEAVVITSNGGGASGAVAVGENGTTVTTMTSTDPEGVARNYAIAGGADAARFTINAVTGVLSFVSAPNFEAPTDAGGNNVYDVIVSASDGTTSDTQALAVTVTNVNEAVVITSNGGGASATVAVNENTTAVTTVTSTDPDGVARSYAIVGGADAARFTINATTGALSFASAPNHEAPTDAGANNVYDVIVQASDGVTTDTQTLAVTVGNVRDGSTLNGTSAANTINGTVAEDTINGQGGNDTITGGLGADWLTGGAGADRFVYNAAADSLLAATDIIYDFSRSQGDKISLNPMDANSSASGNQNFAFIGTAAFSGVAGQLRYQQISGNTFVSGDVNGDGVADFMIQVNGAIAFVAADFIL